MAKKLTVYGLVDPEVQDLFYVGCTVHPIIRLGYWAVFWPFSDYHMGRDLSRAARLGAPETHSLESNLLGAI